MNPSFFARIARRPAPLWVILGLGVLAFVVRIVFYVKGNALTGIRAYDDAVMMTGALRLIHGQMPYVDFTYLHPAGSLLLFTPQALLADLTNDSVALAVARVFGIATGAACVSLIAWLLRSRGILAILVGCGLYAMWPISLLTDRTIFLEPPLNLFLLIALVCLASRRKAAMWVAGIALGIALSIKYWAVFDVVIVGVAIACVLGIRALWRYLAAGVATTLVLFAPFFFHGPAAMWEQTVTTQMIRPSVRSSVTSRAESLSPLLNIEDIDRLVPSQVWGVIVLALLAAGLVPLVRALRRRQPFTTPASDDATWWGLIALVHAAALAFSVVYYPTYASWLIGPLALSTGAAAGRLRAPAAKKATAITLALFVAVSACGEWLRFDSSPVNTSTTAWAAQFRCVWASPEDVLQANATSRNIDNGCAGDVDPFGIGLILGHPKPVPGVPNTPDAWNARMWAQVETSDGVILPRDQKWWWFTPAQRTAFLAQFHLDETANRHGLWSRIEP